MPPRWGSARLLMSLLGRCPRLFYGCPIWGGIALGVRGPTGLFDGNVRFGPTGLFDRNGRLRPKGIVRPQWAFAAQRAINMSAQGNALG